MTRPEFERSVKKSMEEINAKAAAFYRNGIGAFPIADDEVTREAAVRILVERAMKKVLQRSDLPESEQQDLRLRIRSEFDKMYAGRQGGQEIYFPSGS